MYTKSEIFKQSDCWGMVKSLSEGKFSDFQTPTYVPERAVNWAEKLLSGPLSNSE